MKKTLKPQRQQISKQAYTIAKSVTVTDPKLKETQSLSDLNQLVTSQQSEEEIMGETGAGNKSGAMEKNLNQMVNVLNARLKSLEDVVSTRLKLCEDDLLPNSTKMTKTHAPKISDESDEAIPRSLRDTKTAAYHKDNLVSSDTVYIDPYHLVLKTKQTTEAAKQLEQNLEESFGNINLREMKSKKAKKTMNQSEKSKKSEQLKNEAKRINRNKIEKSLQIIMDNFVTRSVMDPDKIFKPPERVTDEADWPISVKWSKRDPNFHNVDNNEGEFDPDLLLRYGLERINLPSGKKLFSWLIRQPIIQRYFISLFWLIKVKFFETENSDGEAYLLRQMAMQYRSIVESLAQRAHAEHEKDFAFKYLPFILANSVYFAFYFMFPGSRHIYTKGFKKTIYMQVIQVMHGVQLCPMSVKVSWIKLFPEDIHEDGEEGEEGGEMFPVQIALKEPKFGTEYQQKMAMSAALKAANEDDITVGSEHTNNTSKGTLPPIRSSNALIAPNAAATGTVSGGIASGKVPFRSKFAGRLAVSDDMQVEDKRAVVRTGLHLYEHHPSTAPGATPGGAAAASGGAGGLAASASMPNMGRRQSTVMPPNMNRRQSTVLKRMKSSSSIFTATTDHNSMDDNRSVHSTHSVHQLIDTAAPMSQNTHKDKTVLSNFFEERTTQDNLLKTFLKPPLEKPKHKFTVKRQNNIESMNAQLVSPQIQLYLVSMESAAAPGLNRVTQTFRRTVPITWCATGGTDTHHKRVVQTELQTEVSNKLKQSETAFRKQTSKFHRLRCDELQEIDTAIDKVLSSGATNISRYSLDIRRQRNANNGEAPTDVTTAMAPTEMTLAEAQQLAMFDDDDLERFIRELLEIFNKRRNRRENFRRNLSNFFTAQRSAVITSAFKDFSDDDVCSVILLFPFVLVRAMDILGPYAGIHTSAGSYLGDGGPATSTMFNVPGFMWLNTDGNLFIMDSGNARIRTIDTSGIVATFAGTGSFTYTGDGTPATSTGFTLKCSQGNTAGTVYVSAQKNVYAIDPINHKISTFAGNGNLGSATSTADEGVAATSAALDTVNGVSIDSLGDVYLMVSGHLKIKKVTVSTGIIHTFAGIGSGTTPENTATDGDGGPASSASLASPVLGVFFGLDFYITGAYTSAVRKINLSTGIISCFAGGTGVAGYSGDGGPATAANLREGATYLTSDGVGTIYVSFSIYHHVRKIDTAGIISLFAGKDSFFGGYFGNGGAATAGRFLRPLGLVVNNGFLYIADSGNNVIRDVQFGPTSAPTLAGFSALPTEKPSPLPSTGGPSVIPTTLYPTIVPSPVPNVVSNTVYPTVEASTDPSVAPLLSPTTSPSGGLTFCPTALPTYPPSLMTSSLPTTVGGPSFCPTSGRPSIRPTVAPSVRPSRALLLTNSPTARPSVSPTVAVVTISFDSTLNLYNVTTSTLNTTSQNAVASTVASTLNISSSQVTYVSQQLVGGSRRRLINVHESYEVLVTVNVIASTQDFADTVGQNASYLYHRLTQSLLNAVANEGAFAAKIRATAAALGAESLYYVGRVNVTVTDFTDVTPVNDHDHHIDGSGLSVGAIIGIVVGSVVLVCKLVFLCFYCFVYRNKRERKVAVASAETLPA